MKIQIPSNVSALAIFGTSTEPDLKAGDALREDWYQYRDGKPLRKWLTNSNGWNHFWPPVVNQLARVERLYRKARGRYNVRWDRQMKLAAEILKIAPKFSDVFWNGCTVPNLVSHHQFQPYGGKDVVVVSAIPIHLLEKDPEKYADARWLFEFYPASEYDLEYGLAKVQSHFHHCSAKDLPPEGIMPKFGQRFYQIYYAVGKCWAGPLKRLLSEALIAYAYAHLPPPNYNGHARNYRLLVNGRTYHIAGVKERKDYTKFSIVSTPDEDDYETIVHETRAADAKSKSRPTVIGRVVAFVEAFMPRRKVQ